VALSERSQPLGAWDGAQFQQLPEGELRGAIEELAASLNFPLQKLFVVDGSTRSAHSNAYMYGFFRNKRIVLYDTLVSQCKVYNPNPNPNPGSASYTIMICFVANEYGGDRKRSTRF
jgi:hypothetical protein